MSAVNYAHLVGRYVSMSRRGDRSPREGLVAVVVDNPEGVSICFDWGEGFVVPRDGGDWLFAIWPDYETRKQWRSTS